MVAGGFAYFVFAVNQGKKRAWGFGLALGVIFLGAALALGLLGGRPSVEEEAFRTRSLDYVAAFATAAQGWLEEGDLETLEDAARFMLLGSAAFVEVVWDGEAVVREARGEVSPPPLEDTPSETVTGFHSRDSAHFLEVVYPLEKGYVRTWLEVPSLAGVPWWLSTVVGLLSLLGLGAIGGALYLRHRSPGTKPERKRSLIEVGGLVIDEGSKEVTLYGKPVKLSPKQYALLVLLAREPGKVFSDRDILRELWPDSRYANSKDVKQYVYLLRRRLGEVLPGAEALIATVPGFGYKLLSPEEIGLTDR